MTPKQLALLLRLADHVYDLVDAREILYTTSQHTRTLAELGNAISAVEAEHARAN